MSERNKTLTRRFYDEVFGKKNLNVMDELCAPEIVDHSALPGQGPGLAGLKETTREYLQAFPDISMTVHEMVSEGDVVVVRFSGQGTHTGAAMGVAPTGKRVSFHGIDMIRVKNGKATEVWHEGNDVAAMAQIGVQMPMTA